MTHDQFHFFAAGVVAGMLSVSLIIVVYCTLSWATRKVPRMPEELQALKNGIKEGFSGCAGCLGLIVGAALALALCGFLLAVVSKSYHWAMTLIG